MSFLWQNHKKKTKTKIPVQKRPSPTHNADSLFFYKVVKDVIKRISLPALPGKKLWGGMTVEAALVLPVLIFFFFSVTSFIEIIRLHGNLQMAIWNTGNKVSVYGTALIGEQKGEEDQIKTLLGEAKDIALSYGYIKGEIVRQLGKDYLTESPLVRGAAGLDFPESEIFTQDDRFELVMTYQLEPWFCPGRLLKFRMANHYFGHYWNGYGIGGEDQKIETVYIAENASVYHTSRECTHLRLTIRETTPLKVAYERNAYGQKYTICEKCGKGNSPGVLYVGIEGDRYHFCRDCPGLKRTIYSMSLWEAKKKYRLCSRCAASD